jgi:hypothetical protein
LTAGKALGFGGNSFGIRSIAVHKKTSRMKLELRAGCDNARNRLTPMKLRCGVNRGNGEKAVRYRKDWF